MVVFGFLFVTVSSRLTGEIGSSSNPISGMTVATLLLTSLIFLALGWVSAPYKIAALSIAGVVCIASSNGGTTSQDLKTGYLVGATPSRQQIAILIGTISSALVIGFILLKMNDAATVFAKRDYPGFRADVAALTEKQHLRGPDAAGDAAEYHVLRLSEPREGVPAGKYLVDDQGKIRYLEDPGINGQVKTRDTGEKVEKYNAPKAMLMSFIIDGIMSRKLPWSLVLIGVFISILLELLGLSSLAFAVGVYLPVSTSIPIMIGGLVRWAADRTSRRKLTEAEAESGPGVLFSSGLIAGGAVTGMILALIQLGGPGRAVHGVDQRHGEASRSRAATCSRSCSSSGWPPSCGWSPRIASWARRGRADGDLSPRRSSRRGIAPPRRTLRRERLLAGKFRACKARGPLRPPPSGRAEAAACQRPLTPRSSK